MKIHRAEFGSSGKKVWFAYCGEVRRTAEYPNDFTSRIKETTYKDCIDVSMATGRLRRFKDVHPNHKGIFNDF